MSEPQQLPEPELPPTSAAYGPASAGTPRGHEADPAMLVIGESLIDIVEREGEEPAEHVGGSPANVAIGLARLGHPVELTTWFGPDARGQRIRQQLEGAEVTVTAGSEGADHTPTARARIDGSGAADYVFDLSYDVPDLTPVREPALVHVGSIAATIEPGAAKIAQLVEDLAPLATISYDPNARPAIMAGPAESRRQMEALVARTDVVKVSDEDIAWLAPGESLPEVARAWLALGPGLVVVTRGTEGASAFTAAGVEIDVPAPRVTVADTVGAGDSFMAGIIDGLARAGLLGAARRQQLRSVAPDALRSVLERAAAVAAITVSRAGANPPTTAELTAARFEA